MYVTSITDVNTTNDYDDITDLNTTNGYKNLSNNITDNCTIIESNIDKIIPTLLLTISCGLSFLC